MEEFIIVEIPTEIILEEKKKEHEYLVEDLRILEIPTEIYVEVVK